MQFIFSISPDTLVCTVPLNADDHWISQVILCDLIIHADYNCPLLWTILQKHTIDIYPNSMYKAGVSYINIDRI